MFTYNLKMMTAELSQRMKNMSVLCAILVVSIHLEWGSDSGVVSLFRQLIPLGIAKIAVPYFFAVSGYFLAGHLCEPGYWRIEVSKRVRTLLLPFALWSVIALFSCIPISIVANIIAGRPLLSNHPFHSGLLFELFGFNFCKNPSYYPLWYIRCLFVFVLLSPFFRWALMRIPRIVLALTFIVGTCCVVAHEWGWITPLLMLCERGVYIYGAFFFLLGMSARVRDFEMPKRMGMICWGVGLGLLCANVALNILVFDTHESPPMILSPVYIPFLLWAVFDSIPTRQWPFWFVQCSFPIYTMHLILKNYASIILRGGGMHQGLMIFISWMFCLVCSIVISVFVHRKLPRVAKALWGGR